MNTNYLSVNANPKPCYSNLVIYGSDISCNGNCGIVPPVPVSSQPTLFAFARPHKIPQQMEDRVVSKWGYMKDKDLSVCR